VTSFSGGDCVPPLLNVGEHEHGAVGDRHILVVGEPTGHSRHAVGHDHLHIRAGFTDRELQRQERLSTIGKFASKIR